MSGPFSDEVPSEIAATDRLGRGEWSRRSARRSFRKRMERRGNRVPVSRFMPPEGSNEISVDRLGLASDITMAEIGARNAPQFRKRVLGLVCFKLPKKWKKRGVPLDRLLFSTMHIMRTSCCRFRQMLKTDRMHLESTPWA